MFNGSDEHVRRAPVFLTLTDGAVLTGSVRLTMTNRLADALNNSDVYLDVLSAAGQQFFIAKSAVRSVRSAQVPKADQLDPDKAAPGTPAFDPHAVLKVSKEAGPEEIRHAYHRMARLYHPDRIASYELPSEVTEYVRAMLVRINLAYEQLGA